MQSVINRGVTGGVATININKQCRTDGGKRYAIDLQHVVSYWCSIVTVP